MSNDDTTQVTAEYSKSQVTYYLGCYRENGMPEWSSTVLTTDMNIAVESIVDYSNEEYDVKIVRLELPL